MRRRHARSAAPLLSSAAHAHGFRTVEQVRVRTIDGRTTAEVTGILHRYPQTVPVSLATATDLVGAGAPLSVEHSSSPTKAS